MNFSIIGAGAWGTAMAIHLARMNHTVTLVPRRMDLALELSTNRENKPYLPDFKLADSIQIGCELKPVLMETEVVLIAYPTKYLRWICGQVSEHLKDARQIKIFISLCKGLEEGTNLKSSEVLAETLPGYLYGALSGPTYAREVAEGKPTAIVFAATDKNDFTLDVQKAMSNSHLRVYRSNDLEGVELGGSLKNVYAIASGVLDGLDLGDNAKAALLSRSLNEMVRLGSCLGGKVETFYGLSGIGDLVVTCNGDWSRNRTFGELIAKGQSPKSLIESGKMTVEGYQTTDCFHKIYQKQKLTAPILDEVHAVLFSGKKPLVAMESLMSRELKEEWS